MVNWVTCSADSISRLTNPQIRYIIDYVTSKIVNIVNDQTSDSVASMSKEAKLPVSDSGRESSSEINLIKPKVSVPSALQTLMKTEVSVLPEKVHFFSSYMHKP